MKQFDLPTFASFEAVAASGMTLNTKDAAADMLEGGNFAASEVGEICDMTGRLFFDQQPLDVFKLKGEVHDVIWNLVRISKAAGFTLQDAVEAGSRKLAVRRKGPGAGRDRSMRNTTAEYNALKGEVDAAGA